MKTLTAAAISGALLATSAVLLPTAAVAVDTCRGQAATIAPGPDGHLVGTSGPDVIVAFDDQEVDAGDGDDLICVVASTPVIFVDAGAGDDTVDTVRSHVATAVSLGEGEDTFIGGRGIDSVWGSAPEGLGDIGINPLDTEADEIATGAGDDRVFSGSLGSPNLDQISTAMGDDRIDVIGLDPTLSLDAGSGRNTAIVTLEADTLTGWLIDVAQRKIVVDTGFTETTSHWKGQLHRWQFHLADGQARSSLLFLGTNTGESAFVSGDGLVPHFRMSGGDDWAGNLTTPGGTYRLGPGRDKLTLGKFDSVLDIFPIHNLRVDLASQRATFYADNPQDDIDSPVTGVEILFAGADRTRLYGTPRSERIVAHGCNVEVHGRAGQDVLTRGRDPISICDNVASRLYGNAGNDLLFGSSRTDDLLVGGAGFDRARGMRGDDTCLAEVTRGCEHP